MEKSEKIKPWESEKFESFRLIRNETLSNFKFEQGGMLVYDVKAKVVKCTNSTNLEETDCIDLDGKVLGNMSPLKYKIQGVSPEEFEVLNKIKGLPPCPNFLSTSTLPIPDDDVTLTFNSKFESGNLSRAIKLSDYEYNLQIQSDYNTTGNNHWYYFSVFNPRKSPITFNIINMKRPDFLYLSGMKPAVFSVKHLEKQGVKWNRDCSNVKYFSNAANIYYTLSFTYDFRYSEDLVYFAYAIPYTYTELSEYLSEIKGKYPKIARVDTLCKSLAGNKCEILTITEGVTQFLKYHEETSDWGLSLGGRKLKRMKKMRENIQESSEPSKKAVVFTARVHSGETVSSFMMKGLIDYLLSPVKSAKVLRKKFVFRIIPMLNPDGVRYGNFRCSLLGVDLNRNWENPHKILHPTIYHAKKMIQVLNETNKIVMYCDMHGHTRKKNVFMYGCSEPGSDYLIHRKNLLGKIIPVLMASKNKLFSFFDSHFRMEKDKFSTARIVLHNLLEIPHVYTIEASFCGPRKNSAFGKNYIGDSHMYEEHLRSIGETLGKCCAIFVNDSVYFKHVRLVNDYLRKSFGLGRLAEENVEIPENIEVILEDGVSGWDGIEVIDDYRSESDSGGSESCPSEREFVLKKSQSIGKAFKESPIRKPEINRLSFEPEIIRLSFEPEKNISNDSIRKNYSISKKPSKLPKCPMIKSQYIMNVVSCQIKNGGDAMKIAIVPVKPHRESK